MYYQGWNDYELLYLIEEGNYRALNLMYLKYENFIRIKAKNCGFNAYQLDDCVQEGYLMLRDAIKTYNPIYGKTFTKYFDLILSRRFWRLRQQTSKHEHCYIDNFNLVGEKNFLYEKIQLYKHFFTEEEAYILEQVYYNQVSVKDLSLELDIKIHNIYRILRKIREKLALEFDL